MSSPVIYLNSNDGTGLIGLGALRSLRIDKSDSLHKIQEFIEHNEGQYIFVALSYDLKNSVEKLTSNNANPTGFPDVLLWIPEVVAEQNKSTAKVLSGTPNDEQQATLNRLIYATNSTLDKITFKPRTTRNDYLRHVIDLKEELQRGNIYEINYCQEFYAEKVVIEDGISLYQKINSVTKAPFSCYLSYDEFEIASGSPERFLKKVGNKIISQPIKGTIKRGNNAAEDQELIDTLKNDPKEKAENVMIVDLVRNDLSRIAQKGSVEVEELFGIYTFETVHQMISTVACTINSDVTFTDVVRALFPMGSMTGAPKISAMELIEKHENFKRGIYSGSIGYIDPNGDFDLNVIIRSLIYNRNKNYLSCGVGGAITIQSDPNKEYEECLTKVSSILNCLND